MSRRKVMTLPEVPLWRPPKKGDRFDKRCVFVTKNDDINEVKHGRLTWRQWCYDCEYYICARCDAQQRTTAASLQRTAKKPQAG